MIFEPCFNSVHGSIRAGACDVLAELCQNNPYCQRIVTANGLLKQLLEIVDKDPDDNARIKAVYAISCNVRENSEGLTQFLQFGGLKSVLQSLQRNSDRLRTKCAFLLSCVAGLNTNVRDMLVANNAIPLLISLIATERQPSHEHLLSLFVALITDYPQAIAQCCDPKFNLASILKNHLNQISKKEECQVSYNFYLYSILIIKGSLNKNHKLYCKLTFKKKINLQYQKAPCDLDGYIQGCDAKQLANVSLKQNVIRKHMKISD